MIKKLFITFILLAAGLTAMAQEPASQPAIVVDTVNVRAGSAQTFEKIGEIRVRSNVTVEGRNRVGDWVLVRAEDGLRGWAASR